MYVRLDALTTEQLTQAHINGGFTFNEGVKITRILNTHPTDVTGTKWVYEVLISSTPQSINFVEQSRMVVEFEPTKMAFIALFA
jgi:hypothetical protein